MDKTIPFAPQDALCDQWQGYYKEEYALCQQMTSAEECPEVHCSVCIVCAMYNKCNICIYIYTAIYLIWK
jgi:hypothetical protein